MDTPPSPASRHLPWVSALRIGNHTFSATWLLTLLAALVAVIWVPFLAYVFGSGWVAPLVAALAFFGMLLIFKNWIFRSLYKNAADGGEAALLEYLVQHNVSGAPGEEEMEMELLENALHLKRVRAQNCMAPRPEIVHVDVEAPVEELRQIFIESSLSRVLVTDGDLDTVLGYVHVQQMFAQPRSIRSMVMPITFVPESIAVNDLLSKFIRNRTNIACVVDEYGSLSGLVTLEDALEQLFGDIDDEHDQEEYIDVQVGEREYLFSGRLKLEYLNEKYPALALPPGDYQTLSGYLVTVGQNIPEQGQRLQLDGKTFIFELVSDRKVETVRVLT
ncbi:MAG TPA: transporter associated domain-containing protein [Saprospiraceae bacterium]|nr:transporter associated domain-containing protein [Saprospiraceae bacterium]HND89761.1 transporter associated domain-containing protein [Saprospiraceae bacterium]